MPTLDNAEYCPDGHRCLNGSKCMQDSSTTSSYVCDCSSMPNYSSDPHAGRYCEFGVTMICHEDSMILDVPTNFELSFCTNGGVCNEILAVDEVGREHAGCDCLEGYEGEMCEYPTGTKGGSHSKFSNSHSASENDPAVIWILVLSFVSLIAFCILGRREMQRRKSLKEAEKIDDLVMRANTDAVVKGEGSMPNVEELKNFGNVSVVISRKTRTTEQTSTAPTNQPTDAPISTMPSQPPPPPPLEVDLEAPAIATAVDAQEEIIDLNDNSGALMKSSSEEVEGGGNDDINNEGSSYADNEII